MLSCRVPPKYCSPSHNSLPCLAMKTPIRSLAELGSSLQLPPRNPATATAFADWVFRGRIDVQESEAASDSMRVGNELHAKLRYLINDGGYRDIPPGQKVRDLEVLYEDTGQSAALTASRLKVNGQPLKCKPDFVCQSRVDGAIYIFEHKSG